MRAVTNIENIVDILKEKPGKKYTARQIADDLYSKFPQECENKKNKSTQDRMKTLDGFMKQLAGEVNREIRHTDHDYYQVKFIIGPPWQFYWSEQTEEKEEVEATKVDRTNPKEYELYPLLSQYLNEEFSLWPKRINEKSSRKKSASGANKWLYPDLVALETLSDRWDNKTKACASLGGGKLARLWSFEVKVSLNRSNIRESFFQTSSNSLWANYGYLVASEITANTYEEAGILSDAYGIGLMRLDINNLNESRVLIQAKEREINWDITNRLVEANLDFGKYVEEIELFLSKGKIIEEHWDLNNRKD